MHGMTFKSEAAQRRIERIQHLLRREYLTIYEIADGIHMSHVWARTYIRYLREQKKVFIYEWRLFEGGKRYHLPVYAWGDAKDAKKPVETNAERLRRRYKERKQDPDAYDRFLAKARAIRWKPRCDIAASWIPKKDERKNSVGNA